MAKKRLEIVNATDANLKLVRDEDGTDTSLSLADKGNGAKVTGNLAVTGTVDIKTEGTLNANQVKSNSTGSVIDIDTDINLTAKRTLALSATNGSINSNQSIHIKEIASAAADEAAFGQIWVKSDTPNNLYFTDDTGQDVQITNNGSLASSGGTSYHYMQHQWYANASTNVYLPFAASVNESSSTSDVYIDDTVWIPMFNGKLTELKLYTDSDTGSTDLKLSVNGSLGSSMLSGGAVNCSSDKTVYTFTCDQNNTFSSGDVVKLFIEPTNAPLWSTASTKWEIS